MVKPVWRGRAALLAVLTVCGALASIFPATARATAAELPYRLEPAMTSSVGSQQRGLVADGSLIVWEDSRSGTPDIFAYDLDDRREFRVARSAGEHRQPAISGSIILWVSGADPTQRHIEGIDLNTSVPIPVTDQPGEVSEPALSDNLVVWRQRTNGVWDILGKNLATGETFRVTDDGANQAHPSISGTNVVWQDYRNGNWDLFRYDLATRAIDQLTDDRDAEVEPVISGDYVLFRRNPVAGGAPQLVLLDLRNRSEKTITSDHLVMLATMKGNIVVWEDWRSGLPDIYAYDLAHDQTFAVARSQQAHCPAVSDTSIAWISRGDLVSGRVQALTIVERLPTDPRDPPAVPSPDNMYVQETQHFMSAGFKSFWQANGGPQLFGYPLTEEFTETDPETGEERVVQYFERVKMEYHPDAPEGARITLARLGTELTQDRDFPPVEPVENSDDRVYFPETGHTIAFGFKEFWDENGGLGIFGYPISEEFTENGRTVQYFERARFEFNPDAADGESHVTLGLLGHEALQRKGWLPMPPIDTTSLLE